MRRMMLAALLLAAPAGAATLRPFGTLAGPVVRLSDLWDGVTADRAIGPGPPIGGRIVVGAAQLGAIARQFSVDWQPASPGDQAVLEWLGQPLTRDAALQSVTQSLQAAGIPADATVELTLFTPPMIPANATPPTVADLAYDPATGRFSAVLAVAAPGAPPTRTPIEGRVVIMETLPVATRRIGPGEVIGPGDLRMATMPAGRWPGVLAHTLADAVGMAPRRPVSAGQPIDIADLGRPVLVRKNAVVAIRLESAGITLTAEGVATEAAGLGEHVRVLNPSSRAILDAEVTGPGRVRILPGSLPLATPPGSTPVPARLLAQVSAR